MVAGAEEIAESQGSWILKKVCIRSEDDATII